MALETRRRVVARVDDEISAAGLDVFAARTVAGFAAGLGRPSPQFQNEPARAGWREIFARSPCGSPRRPGCRRNARREFPAAPSPCPASCRTKPGKARHRLKSRRPAPQPAFVSVSPEMLQASANVMIQNENCSRKVHRLAFNNQDADMKLFREVNLRRNFQELFAASKLSSPMHEKHPAPLPYQ